MLMAGLRLGTPQINTFNSDAAPGKTKVSFAQWYHEAQCIKDQYPESIVQESIIRSLKGEAVDMAQYMGPTASVNVKILLLYSAARPDSFSSALLWGQYFVETLSYFWYSELF